MSAAVARKARACERGDSVVLAVARASPRLVRARAVCVRRAAWAGRGRITPCAAHPRRHPTLRARGRGKGNCPSRRTGPLVTLDCRCHSSIRTPWAPAATRGRTTPHVVHHLDLAIIHCRRAGNLLTPQSSMAAAAGRTSKQLFVVAAMPRGLGLGGRVPAGTRSLGPRARVSGSPVATRPAALGCSLGCSRVGRRQDPTCLALHI